MEPMGAETMNQAKYFIFLHAPGPDQDIIMVHLSMLARMPIMMVHPLIVVPDGVVLGMKKGYMEQRLNITSEVSAAVQRSSCNRNSDN